MNFDVAEILLFIIPAIVAITFHEAAHGFTAYYFGDPTAKNAGRLTLNPVKHVDAFGTVILPLMLLLSSGGRIMFGYAKPVPVDFNRLRNPRWNMILVAFAGPGMNIVLALVSAFLLRIAFTQNVDHESMTALLLNRSIQLNAILAVFNLVPIPPLDGSKVLAPLLPWAIARPYMALERFGMIILLVLLFVLPMLADRTGIDFDFFGTVVIGPAAALINFISAITGT